MVQMIDCSKLFTYCFTIDYFNRFVESKNKSKEINETEK